MKSNAPDAATCQPTHPKPKTLNLMYVIFFLKLSLLLNAQTATDAINHLQSPHTAVEERHHHPTAQPSPTPLTISEQAGDTESSPAATIKSSLAVTTTERHSCRHQ
ncbi:hypothetical protein Dimus_002420 [Dionaea muscipula]